MCFRSGSGPTPCTGEARSSNSHASQTSLLLTQTHWTPTLPQTPQTGDIETGLAHLFQGPKTEPEGRRGQELPP